MFLMNKPPQYCNCLKLVLFSEWNICKWFILHCFCGQTKWFWLQSHWYYLTCTAWWV